MYVEILTRVLLIIGGINYLFVSIINTNLFTMITNATLQRFVTFSVGVSALMLVFDRDYYLPFLGRCVLPSNFFSKGIGSIHKKQINNIPRSTNVIYWAANSSDSGMTRSNENGEVTLEFTQLPISINYRYELSENKGMFSRVYSKKITSQLL